MRKLLSVLLVLLVLVGCSSGDSKKEETNTDKAYKVGVVDTYQSKTWNYIKEEAAKEGIQIEVLLFDDYPIPNRKLDDGEIDINSFQHTVYLNQEVEENGYKIQSIGKTIIEPMAIYSNKLTSVEDVQDGAIVAIPDDVTNGARALNLLADANLIELDTTPDQLPDLKNVVSNPKNLQFNEVAATMIPGLLNEVDFGVINGGVAMDSNLSLENDTIYVEEISLTSENPFINVLAVRNEDKDNADLKRLVELFQSEKVKEIIVEETNGGSIPVWE